MSDSREIIAKLALDIRKKLKLESVRNIDMLEVLKKLDIILEENTYNGAEGTIRSDNGKYIISLERQYNEDNPRDKFTLAHEIGHLFLHIDEESEGIVFTRKGTTQAEYDANEFAANFLMPEVLYREAVMDLAENNEIDINELANVFGVSCDAAITRGKFLGVFKW